MTPSLNYSAETNTPLSITAIFCNISSSLYISRLKKSEFIIAFGVVIEEIREVPDGSEPIESSS